eukprot:SAG31_NODE_510_length_14725_cov_2.829482_11_plen_57_part_00
MTTKLVRASSTSKAEMGALGPSCWAEVQFHCPSHSRSMVSYAISVFSSKFRYLNYI